MDGIALSVRVLLSLCMTVPRAILALVTPISAPGVGLTMHNGVRNANGHMGLPVGGVDGCA